MVMQSKAWMTNFLFKEFLSFFKRSITCGISLTNKHLLILDGHESHVTLIAIKQAQTFGFNMITLLSHIIHELQLLDVAYFKLFKIAFKKERDVAMASNNYTELDKVILANQVEKALD
jgi:hypothetical protein